MDHPQTREALVFRVPMLHPGDTSGIEDLIDTGAVEAGEIVAIFGKTEGNGCVNDFTRGYAVLAIETMLAEKRGCARAEIGQSVAIVISGGTEGGLSPHFVVFATRAAAEAQPGPGLAIGVAFTRPFLPEEIGRTAQVDETMEAITRAMAMAGVETERRCALRADEVSAVDEHAGGGGRLARRDHGDHRHLRLDGALPCRLGARGGGRAR